jgi:hypothetical protein
MKASCVLILILCSAAARGNLVQNPGFEAEGHGGPRTALNWKMNEPDDHGDSWGSATRETWRSREGQCCATVRGTWAEAGDHGGWWQETEVERGKRYRLSAWLWADSTWSANVQQIKIEFWNTDRSFKLGEAAVFFNDISEMWMEKFVEGLAPDGSFWARAVINVSGAGPKGALHIDDVSLVAMP